MSNIEEYKTARYIARLGITGVVIIFLVGFAASAYNRKIEAEKAAVVEQERTERQQIAQSQKTERTEERSQFWQSLVPWGTDEAEKNE